ncbi:MAG: chemotaxis-specific protein-glutamate methyltransferase CheB [Chloroflexota bacterium]
MIRVLLVDDSATTRQLMRHIIQSDPELQVIAEASDGQQAVNVTRRDRPDIVLMDIVMPVMDGLDATQVIMAQTPTPIVLVSGAMQGKETDLAFRAIRQGALTLLPKPVGPDDPAFADQANRLRATLRALAGVRVIHHNSPRPPQSAPAVSKTVVQGSVAEPPQIVAITASTGGPAALAEIFQRLPANFAVPVVVVQHIAADFLNSLRGWLNQTTPLQFELAAQGQPLLPGHVYFGPIGRHLCFDARRQVCFRDTPKLPHTPAGDVLFESVAERFGAAAVGVLLTGMGADGAAGLLAMRQQGAVTIAQDQASCAVFGMPAEAIKLGAARHTLPLHGIARMLTEIVQPASD